MKATLFYSSISANLGNSGRRDQLTTQMACVRKLWLPHFRTFCELVEGEENKLTTISTWTIMNESNTTFQQHLCKLGQLLRNIIYTIIHAPDSTRFPAVRNECSFILCTSDGLDMSGRGAKRWTPLAQYASPPLLYPV